MINFIKLEIGHGLKFECEESNYAHFRTKDLLVTRLIERPDSLSCMQSVTQLMQVKL